MNLFKLVSFTIAIAAFIKVFFGVFFHQRFYKWALTQYSKPYRTAAVNLLLAYALFLLILTWIGVFTNYVQYGWILIVIVTIASVKSLTILFNWQATATKFQSFIKSAGYKKLWFVDLVVMILGLIFLLMAVYLY